MNYLAIRYQIGTPEALHVDAVCLYEEAFGEKFSVAIPDQTKRLQVIADAMMLEFSVAAIASGALVGIAGFQTPQGSLTGGITASVLFRRLGLFGALRALLVFMLYARKPAATELLMDGIVVGKAMRSHGIGTLLLERIKEYAHTNGYSQVRLDVIDTNPAAKKLYERRGFIAIKTAKFEFLRSLLGFGAATTMVYRIGEPQ